MQPSAMRQAPSPQRWLGGALDIDAAPYAHFAAPRTVLPHGTLFPHGMSLCYAGLTPLQAASTAVAVSHHPVTHPNFNAPSAPCFSALASPSLAAGLSSVQVPARAGSCGSWSTQAATCAACTWTGLVPWIASTPGRKAAASGPPRRGSPAHPRRSWCRGSLGCVCGKAIVRAGCAATYR